MGKKIKKAIEKMSDKDTGSTIQVRKQLTADEKKMVKELGDKVKAALDGRPQRWLARQLDWPDDKLSNRIAGIIPFKEDELQAVNRILKTDIRYSKKIEFYKRRIL